MSDSPAQYRSGAVARMLRMPVATLRVWERRYAVCEPALTPSGQRLYTAAQIQRLALIRQLIDQGHAIGTLAHLDMAALQAVAHTHAGTVARPRQPEPEIESSAVPALAVHVPDRALRERLQRPGLCQLLRRPLQTNAPASAAWHLHRSAGLLAAGAQRPPAAQGWGVLYRYAGAEAEAAYTRAGAELLREPADDAALADWLNNWLPAAPALTTSPPRVPELGSAPPPRWDDASLAAFAGLSSTIACECPKHLAELLMQLSQFEAYSADCAAQGPTDAELHRYLGQVTAQARVLLEEALGRVAEAEGLLG